MGQGENMLLEFSAGGLVLFFTLVACALVLIQRSIQVLHQHHHGSTSMGLVRYVVFTASYLLLAGGALVKVIDSLDGQPSGLGGSLLLIASAGLVLTERRRM